MSDDFIVGARSVVVELFPEVCEYEIASRGSKRRTTLMIEQRIVLNSLLHLCIVFVAKCSSFSFTIVVELVHNIHCGSSFLEIIDVVFLSGIPKN